MRGLVILLLVPDLSGAFSLPEMARLHPDDAVWAALAQQASHVPWRGVALWDLVMPAFVLLVGVSMGLSIDRRREDGMAHPELVAHVATRSAALVVLGMLLQMTHRSVWTEMLPYAILAAALPWSDWLPRRLHLEWLPALVTAAVALWLSTHVERLEGYSFNQILTQLGLAYGLAFVLMGRGVIGPLVAAAAVLALYGLAFIGYHPSGGLPVRGEVMTGLFAYWNNGANLAAAIDRWLFGWLPRSEPFVDNSHGYHAIAFVALSANVLLGVVVGRLLARGSRRALPPLLALGASSAIGGGLLAISVFPLIKSLWTPSWALVSGGLCVLALGGFVAAFDAPGRERLGRPLVVLGANALLLYVVSGMDRWRIVAGVDRLAGEALLLSPYRPLLESVAVLTVLWLLAAALYRRRIYLRL